MGAVEKPRLRITHMVLPSNMDLEEKFSRGIEKTSNSIKEIKVHSCFVIGKQNKCTQERVDEYSLLIFASQYR